MMWEELSYIVGLCQVSFFFMGEFNEILKLEERKSDRTGVFSTNSFVQVLQQENLSEDITSYSFTSTIWRGLVPSKVELFAWFVLVWCAWLMTTDRAWVVPKTVKELFERWIEVPDRKSEQKKWLIGFFAVIWNIWLKLNSRVFRSCETGVDGIKNRSFMSYKEKYGVDLFSC
ncbi:hypothetical protein AHAS_Ahas15G0157300 [Arachis hypogaea]